MRRLQQKNETALARVHFARALEMDPNLAGARQWLAMLDHQQVAEAQPRPDAHHGAYAPVSGPTGVPAALPVYPTTQPRVSMDSEFYRPSRYQKRPARPSHFGVWRLSRNFVETRKQARQADPPTHLPAAAAHSTSSETMMSSRPSPSLNIAAGHEDAMRRVAVKSKEPVAEVQLAHRGEGHSIAFIWTYPHFFLHFFPFHFRPVYVLAPVEDMVAVSRRGRAKGSRHPGNLPSQPLPAKY